MNGEALPLSGVALLTAKLELGSGPQVFVVAIANLNHEQTLVAELDQPPHYGFSLEDDAGEVYWSWEGPALDNNGNPLTRIEVLPRQYATLDHRLKTLELDDDAPNDLLLKGFLRSLNLPFRGQLGVRR